jgi:effector-binding domain-containing protein
VIAIEVVIRSEDAVAEWVDGFTRLHRWLAASGAERTGPDAALFAAEFFEDGIGAMTMVIPVTAVPAEAALPAGAALIELPAADVAVLTHDGPFGDLDLTYGELGAWVNEQAASGAGPIREYYLPNGDPDDLLDHRTEVCWPIRSP